MSGDHFGVNILHQSLTKGTMKYVDLKDITKYGAFFKDMSFTIRGRLQSSRGKGNAAFVVVRDQMNTLQACGFVGDEGTPNITKEFVKFINHVPKESVVDITGTLISSKVESCSIKDWEFQISRFFVVSMSTSVLPFQISDANNSVLLDPRDEVEEVIDENKDKEKKGKGKKEEKEKDQQINVNSNTRLNQRWLDLRTETSQSIMRVKTKIAMKFRQQCVENEFVEIFTPKLIPGASEGGASVFTLKQFNTTACLAQSPQLYKQMAICSDLKRVFEIGPVFRAENSMTHRHLCEFTGADIEMVFKEHQHEVLQFVFDMLMQIFESVQSECKFEMETIFKQQKAEPFKWTRPVPVFSYKEAIDMLIATGDLTAKQYEDLTTPQEKVLGKLISDKYHTDFYCIEKYPMCIRPFQTMPAPDEPLEMDGIKVPLSNSQDIFMRGEEIISGAQRCHDPKLLEKQCTEKGIPIEGVKNQIDAFRQGCEPHAGIGIGLDRVVMLFCGLKNIRSSNMFPRDPKRIKP